MIALLIAPLAAGAAPIASVSDLVPDGHRHEWVEVLAPDGNIAFIDVAYSGTAEIAGKIYPLVLLRYQRGQPGEETAIVDVRIGIDCEGNIMAPLDIYRMTGTVGATGMRLGQREALPTRLDRVYPQNEARVAPLFKQACGPDWSMKEAR